MEALGSRKWMWRTSELEHACQNRIKAKIRPEAQKGLTGR
jgi:hypothetical protein